MEKHEKTLKRHGTTKIGGLVFWDVLGVIYGFILWNVQRHMLTCQFACSDIIGTFDQGYVQVTVQSHRCSLISQLTTADVHVQPRRTLRDQN